MANTLFVSYSLKGRVKRTKDFDSCFGNAYVQLPEPKNGDMLKDIARIIEKDAVERFVFETASCCILFFKTVKIKATRFRKKNNKGHKIHWGKIFYPRVVNALERAGINTLDELKSKTDAELLRIKYFGRKSLKEVKAYLAKH